MSPFELEFEHQIYYVYAWLIVLFMILAPFVPFLFGWRLGEKVPVTRARVFGFGFLICLSVLIITPTFSGCLLMLFWLPVIMVAFMAGGFPAILLIAWPLYGFGITWWLLRYDRVWVRRKTESE